MHSPAWSQQQHVITVQHVSKTFHSGKKTIVALEDVSLDVQPGEIFGVIGESGAGKSTLIRCINQLERPTSGSIVVDGQEITALRGKALRHARQHIGMIFQGFNLLSSRTVAENVALPLEIMGVPRAQRKARVAELLALVGLEHRADAYPARLSGGQKQRVGIARALAGSPKVLLSDEATSALDPRTTTTILDLLKELNQRLNLTILLITHDMEVVKRICDRVAVLEEGRIVESGAVRELALTPRSRIATALFPQPDPATLLNGTTRVTLPIVGEQDPLGTLLPDLQRGFGVTAMIATGSIETIGGERLGQLHLDLRGEGTPAAVSWLQANQPGVSVR